MLLYPDEAATIPEDAVFTGAFLMSIGFNRQLNLKRNSVVVEFKEVS